MQRLLPAFLTLSFVACAVQKSGEPAQAPGEPPPPVPPASQPQQQQQGYPSTPATPGNVLRGEHGDDFASVEDAERELERARRELVSVVSDKKNREPKASEQPAPLANGDSECGNACKAFASLRRAANGVCRLTNEGDARCVRARSVVKENETRVAACGCEPPKD